MGYDQEETRTAILQEYQGQFSKPADLNGILDNALQGAVAPRTPQQEQADRVLTKQQDLEAKGIYKLDLTDGSYVPTGNATDIQNAADAGLITWNGSNWQKDGKDIADPSKIKFDSGKRWWLHKSAEEAKVTIK